jgi:hypothetical protein
MTETHDQPQDVHHSSTSNTTPGKATSFTRTENNHAICKESSQKTDSRPARISHKKQGNSIANGLTMKISALEVERTKEEEEEEAFGTSFSSSTS